MIVGGGAFMTIKRPAVAAGILLCTYVIEQWLQTQDTLFVANRTLVNFAVASLVVLAVLIRMLKRETVFKPFPPAAWCMLGLLAYSAISSVWSPHDGAVERLTGILPYFIAFGILLPLTLSTFEDLLTALVTMLIVGTTLTVLAMTLSDWDGRGLALAGSITMAGIGRTSESSSPLALSSLSCSLALIVVLLNFRGVGRFLQFFRWGVVLLALFVALKSDTRGQVFAMLIAGPALLPVSRRIASWRGFFATAIGMVFLLGIGTVLVDVMVGGSERWSPDTMVQVYSDSRIGTAGLVLEAWLAGGPLAWFFGLGFSASFDPDILGFYPHVVIAEALGEMGVIGFLLTGLMPVFAARSLYRLWPVIKDYPEARGVTAAVSALLFFDIILSFKQGTLLSLSSAMALTVVLGRLELTYVPRTVQQPAQNYFDELYGAGFADVPLPNLGS